MARTGIPIAVIDRVTGAAIQGASVTVRKRSDNSLATVYSGETGTGTTPNPLATDANGRVAGWLDRGAYKLTVSGAGITTPYDEFYESAPGADRTVDAQWAASSLLPVGIMLPYAGDTEPSVEWLMCDGRAVSRSAYASLFNAIGVLHGIGDGSTTFNLPDTRGRVFVGKGTHAEVDAVGDNDGLAVGSRKLKHRHSKGTLNITASGSHSHGTPNGFAFLTTNTTGGLAGDAGAQPYWPPNLHQYSTGNATHSHGNADFAGEVGDTAGPLDGPAYLVGNYVIKAL